jgi:hypothetical protein
MLIETNAGGTGQTMSEPGNDKQVPNLRVSDVAGLAVLAGLALIALYLIAMLVYHWIAGHPPP